MFTLSSSRVGGLKLGLLLTGILCLSFSSLVAQALPLPTLLDPATQPKFVNPLPNPLAPAFIYDNNGVTITKTIDETTPEERSFEHIPLYKVGMHELRQPLGLVDPANPLNPLPANGTLVWGYGNYEPGYNPNVFDPSLRPTYPGKTFVVQKDHPIAVEWSNDLPVSPHQGEMHHFLPVDNTLHWADPFDPHMTGGPAATSTMGTSAPVIPHVHGGHTRSGSDGLPEYWWAEANDYNPETTEPNVTITGKYFGNGHGKTLFYDNDQEAGTIWYHDHALGITRLNVYAGLAGFYIIRDENDTGEEGNAYGLPTYPYEVPIVIQDKMFDSFGEMYYPSDPFTISGIFGYPDPNALPNPTVGAEFMGNFILVNGVVWPKLDVEPRLYRFRVLNGSDSRFYNLFLSNGDPIVQIGTDDALMETPVPVSKLLVGPGERADILIDFSAYAGQRIILKNNARTPFPKGGVADPQTVGQIMAFDVSPNPPTSTKNNTVRTSYRSTINALTATPGAPVQKLALYEGMDQIGRLMPMLGTTTEGMQFWDDAITERPELGTTQIWEVYNNTADAHPIHLHLVAFQILSRQKFRATLGPNGEMAPNQIKLLGQPKGPEPNEVGWKDTGIMYPGEVTRVIAKFDRPGRYVWHCHILSHEDHEMMRPYEVVYPSNKEPNDLSEDIVALKAFPNPFNGRTTLRYTLPEAGNVSVKVFNTMGQQVATLMEGHQQEGLQELSWNAEGMAPGVYLCRLTAGDEQAIVRLMVAK